MTPADVDVTTDPERQTVADMTTTIPKAIAFLERLGATKVRHDRWSVTNSVRTIFIEMGYTMGEVWYRVFEPGAIAVSARSQTPEDLSPLKELLRRVEEYQV